MSSILPIPSLLLSNNLASLADPESIHIPRPLLPRTHQAIPTQSLPAELAERQTKRSRTNVTVACDSCKQARAKCDGKSPCVRCLKRTLSCKYDHGNDKRQNRGSVEEVQALTDRLGQYQKFVSALRSSSSRNADHALERLRSSEEFQSLDPPGPAVGVAPLAAASLPFSTGAGRTIDLDGMDLEETYELVGWIKHDMDTGRANSHTASLSKEMLPDQDVCDLVEASSPRKGSASLQQLLC